MKSLKLLALFVVFGLVANSCSDSDPVQGAPSTEQSIALRTALNEIKKATNLSGRADSALCFDFVYPVTLSFNNGAPISVTSLEGLLAILQDETPSLHLSAISYPFQIQQEMETSTINHEAAFQSVLDDCGYTSYNDDIENSFCFDIVFPVSVTSANGTFEIGTYAEFLTYLNGSAAGGVQFVYPISVLTAGQVLTVENLYELYEIIDSCDTCICTYEYEPVCVQTANGILQFGNSCHALCSGFTPNDFIDCGPEITCQIANLTAIPGECSASGTSYQLTIDFDFETNGNATEFKVHSSNGLVGTYNLADLPVTVSMPSSADSYVWVTVVAGQFSSCTEDVIFTAPTCNQPTPSTFATLLMSGCFDMVYPLQVQWQGGLVTVNVDGQLLQYMTPTTPFPPFNYPVSLTYQGVSMTITSDAEFQTAIDNMDCN